MENDEKDDKTTTAQTQQKRKRTDTEPTTSSSIPTVTTPTKSSTILGSQWIAGQSPPRFVTMDELMSAAHGLTNMALAHEIAVDDQFKLSRQIDDDSSLNGRVANAMRRAFWQKLSEELQSTPPVYDMAVSLVREIKEIIISLLLPQHTKLRAEIDENLDVEIIQQRVNHGDTDFRHTADYIISVMGRLCSMARDVELERLKQTDDMCELFQGIFTTLDNMKLDMANFTIGAIRPNLQQTSAQYEREKFNEYLKLNPNCLQSVHDWIKQAVDVVMTSSRKQTTPDKPPMKRVTQEETAFKGEYVTWTKCEMNATLAQAFADLIVNNYLETHDMPDTLVIDGSRIRSANQTCTNLILTTSVVILACQAGGKDLADLQEFKTTIKEHCLDIIAQPDLTTSSSSRTSESLINSLTVLSHTVVKDIMEYRKKVRTEPTDEDLGFDENAQAQLRQQIIELHLHTQPVRALIQSRVFTFMNTVLCDTTAPIRLPPAVSIVQQQLARLTGQILRIYAHNRLTFADIYDEAILCALKTYNQPTAATETQERS